MIASFQVFISQVAQGLRSGKTPTLEQLQTIATELLALCKATEFDTLLHAAAKPGEERLHALAVSDWDGPSVYLVSDGAGVSSPPHEHQTWAVIVGLRGVERNTRYLRVPGQGRWVVQQGVTDVGAGEFLCMAESEIHATEVVGDGPTYHVHLYGRALSALPTFAERCFVAQPEAPSMN